MGPLIRVLPFLALLGAAVDTVLVRREFSHRPVGLDLFLQAFALWCVFALLALIPAGLQAARRRRREPSAPPASTLEAATDLALWLCVPVFMHARLNTHTRIGADLAAFLAPGPWIELVLIGLGVWLVLRFVRPAVARLPALPLGLAVAVLSIGAGALLPLSAERGLAAGIPAAEGRPNVLLLIWDTARAKSLRLTGYGRTTTPNLDRLAEDSLVFRKARSVSAYTLTSHLSMLTGVYPSHHGARMVRQRFDANATPPVAQDFLEAGYRTGAFVGTGVLRAQTGIEWAFEVYDDQVDPPVCDTFAWALVHDLQSLAAKAVPALEFNGLPHWIQDFQRPASQVLANATAWIENGDPRPYFCLVNLYDVHWPYLPSQAAREQWVKEYDGPIDGYLKRSDTFEEDYELSSDDHRHLLDLYDGEMFELDQIVDQFLERVDVLGGQTALVLTSDHGEAFGEQGRYEHDDILEVQLRVPLLVRPPAGVAGQVLDTPVNGIDVTPTLLDLAGITAASAPDGAQRFTGQSLLSLPHDPERILLVEDRDHFDPTDVRIALYRGRWKLVRRGLGDEEVWGLVDLEGPRNKDKDTGSYHPELVAELQAEFEALRARWGADDDEADLQVGGDGNLAALQALGYLGAQNEGSEE